MDNLYYEGFTQNRELSVLRFNERILEEAADPSVPLLERLRYVSIFSSNLDEFFMVRVGALTSEYEDGSEKIDEFSGMNTEEQLESINEYAEELLKKKDESLEEQIDNLRLLKTEIDAYLLLLGLEDDEGETDFWEGE